MRMVHYFYSYRQVRSRAEFPTTDSEGGAIGRNRQAGQALAAARRSSGNHNIISAFLSGQQLDDIETPSHQSPHRRTASHRDTTWFQRYSHLPFHITIP